METGYARQHAGARERADELMLQYELEGLEAGAGSLYPHVEPTLRMLMSAELSCS